MYRGIKFYEAAVKATNGDLQRDAVSAAMDKAKIDQGPGGGAEMVPGKMHCKMNMYIAAVQSRRRQAALRRHQQRQDGRSARNADRSRARQAAHAACERRQAELARGRLRRVLPYRRGRALVVALHPAVSCCGDRTDL